MFNLYFSVAFFWPTSVKHARAHTHTHTSASWCMWCCVKCCIRLSVISWKHSKYFKCRAFFFFFSHTMDRKWHHRRPHTVARSVEIHGFDIKGHAAREQEREKTETDLTSVLLCSTMTRIFGTIWSFLEFPTTVMARMSSWGGVIDGKSSCFRHLALPGDQWFHS